MKRLTLYIAVFMGMLTSVACNEYLDKVPDNRTELDSKEKIAELLVNAYPKGSYISFCEVMTDNVGDKGSGVTAQPLNTEPYFWKDFSIDGTDTPASYWDDCYNAIAHANVALEAIDKLGNGNECAAQRGEALVCRAYAHFMLVTLFAKTYDASTAASDLGIPYVTEPEKVVIKSYKRETVAKVYELIEKDLTEGMALISDEFYKIPKCHFTKAAAAGFASRFYLFKKDYEKVIKYADMAIGVNLASKLRNWNVYVTKSYYDLLKTYTLSSESAILLLQEGVSVWGREVQGYRYSLSSQKVDEFFVQKNVTGVKWIYPIYGDEKHSGIPKFNEYFKKTSVDAKAGIPINMIPLLTCEEVLFNKLEAMVMSGQPASSILPLINTFVISRVATKDAAAANLTLDKIAQFYQKPTEKENLLACILNLKQVDFIHEGMRWFDILRHKIEVTHKAESGEVVTLKANDLRRAIQIPQKAINNGITPNPR